MAFENILCEISDGVATVTVNRPDKLNALNAAIIGELDACFTELGADPGARALIVTGAGEKAFVAGADIGELADMSAPAAQSLAERGQSLMDRIENLGKPVIAAVNGFALGGGCELAMACTFRYAGASARLGLPETGLGLIPGYGGTQRLPRLVGPGRALDLILTGRMVGAEEAVQLGLVNRVVPAEGLQEAAGELAGTILKRGPLAVRAALEAVRGGLQNTLAEGQRLEAQLFGLLCDSEDMREGTGAFLEKRKAEFSGK